MTDKCCICHDDILFGEDYCLIRIGKKYLHLHPKCLDENMKCTLDSLCVSDKL
jgi:hypothetical protein